MKVSVIVPNYNHSKYLRQRIDSILNQTFRDFELIILDDYSADASRAIIDEYVDRYPSIMYFYNISNSGSPFRQWDFGIKKAGSEYIWIAESDDFAEPEFLESSIEALEKNENAGLVYCNSKIIDEEKNTEYIVSDQKKRLHPYRWSSEYTNNGLDELKEYLFLNNTINNVSGVLFRKSKYIEAGLADHNMNYCGDWFMYIRLMLISDIAYLPAPLNTIRMHSGSTYHQYFTKSSYFIEVLRVYKFISAKIDLSPSQKIAMARVLAAIAAKKILNGNFPDFIEAVKIISGSRN